MTPDLEMAIPEPVPTAADPFARGWRYTNGRGEEGRVPLTEDDLLYPQEDDFVVNNQAHHDDRDYLMAVFKARVEGRPGLRVLGDHLINFQTPAVKKNLGPDVILFNGEPRAWNPKKAVFPVKTMKARPTLVIEITSPTTRRKDLTDKPKLFFAAGVPVFVLIDLPYGGGKHPGGIVAFQAGHDGYEPLPAEPDDRVWLEVVEIFLAAEDERVVCYDRDGRRIEDYLGLARTATAAQAEAVAEKARADREKARAKREKSRADAEKARADAAARKMADLEAELRRLRGE